MLSTIAMGGLGMLIVLCIALSLDYLLLGHSLSIAGEALRGWVDILEWILRY